MGLIRLWKRHRLARQPLPMEWLEILEGRIPFFRELSRPLRKRFLERLKIFIAEKQFIGVHGMTVTDEVKVVISAWAIRLILKLDLSHYDRLTEIIVYPGDYRHPDADDEMLGEAQEWGVIVLSWEAVLKGAKSDDDGINTAIHEFAHVLDRADGAFDGTPRLRSRKHYKRWREVMTRHFLGLRRGAGAETAVLDEYGSESEAEFFAVATETFFERPGDMKHRLPELYRELERFYGTDPASGA